MRTRLLALALFAAVTTVSTALAQLRHVEGTDAATGTEYARILLNGEGVSASPVTSVALTAAPMLIAQCTRQSSGKLAFELFLNFGDAPDVGFLAPVAPSPAHPRPHRLDVTLDFSGYTHIGGLKRQWEDLRAPSGMLRYAAPGFHSGNLEDASVLLRYLVALPELRVTDPSHSATFQTSPLLTEVRSEPLCKAALL